MRKVKKSENIFLRKFFKRILSIPSDHILFGDNKFPKHIKKSKHNT